MPGAAPAEIPRAGLSHGTACGARCLSVLHPGTESLARSGRSSPAGRGRPRRRRLAEPAGNPDPAPRMRMCACRPNGNELNPCSPSDPHGQAPADPFLQPASSPRTDRPAHLQEPAASSPRRHGRRRFRRRRPRTPSAPKPRPAGSGRRARPDAPSQSEPGARDCAGKALPQGSRWAWTAPSAPHGRSPSRVPASDRGRRFRPAGSSRDHRRVGRWCAHPWAEDFQSCPFGCRVGSQFRLRPRFQPPSLKFRTSGFPTVRLQASGTLQFGAQPSAGPPG